jgi:aspartokinase/homoserine dehydrogenase 1
MVGKELLNQIHDKFSSTKPIEVRVIGLANSQQMCFDAKGIDLKNWKTQLIHSSEKMSIQSFIEKMSALDLPHSIFVDCTASALIANSYPDILKSRISIVTPNKKANSASYSNYCKLKDLAKQSQAKFLYDTNVGAGLPLIHTVKSLRGGGDTIVKIEAILSGTLSYIFNTFDGTIPFSEFLRDAQQRGYTEPDPRDDLNGLDMARKFLILARESGFTFEMEDIAIEPFLPEECFTAASISDFYAQLSSYDSYLSNLVIQTNQRRQALRFIGTLENGKVLPSLKTIDPEHPFFNLAGTDNIASITSHIYSSNPIVIKGPGAGPSITAANVLSNIIQAGSNE